MTESFLDVAYQRAQLAQQQQIKRRRTAAKKAHRLISPDPSSSHAPRHSPTQQVGTDYEDKALDRLTNAGLIPLARNVRCRTGEIDLIMRDDNTLVFIEVRARNNTEYGGAAVSIDYKKRNKILRSAALLLPALTERHWNGQTPIVRFDVVAFDNNEMTWLRAAIDLESNGNVTTVR